MLSSKDENFLAFVLPGRTGRCLWQVTLRRLRWGHEEGDRAMTSARHTPKQMRGKARVHTLLAAAEAVFAEVGYDGASTTLIAQRANTAIGSLYDFFPNKAAIARHLVLQYLTDLEALFAAILTEELASLRVEDMIDRILDPL